MRTYPDLLPRQLYVIVYPEDRWVFLHEENDYVGVEYHLDEFRGRWYCSTLYMSIPDIVQRGGALIQLGE